MTTEVRLTYEDLADIIYAIFQRNNVSPENARLLADNCAACERDGSISHGVFRIPGYTSSLRAGWVDGKAKPQVQLLGPSFLSIDAMNGFSQPAWRDAQPHIAEMISNTGVGVVSIRNSHHFSALWPDIEPLARQGFVCLTMVTGLACVAPYSGRKAVFGTNPIAFATPAAGTDPLIFDFATSAMSNGDLRLAAKSGKKVPSGTGIDGSGSMTDDPATILQSGALLPFGGYKGSALSMMVEIMASALTGGRFSSEVDFSGFDGAETPNTGQIAIVLNPAFARNHAFEHRVLHLANMVRSAGQERLPSDRRYRSRAESTARGIPLSVEQHSNLLSYLDN